MKRYLLLFAAIMIAATAALADATSVVILQHKGNKTMFAPDSIQVAVSQAVDGDTILLSRGQFPRVVINKSITLRGDGQVTKVNGLSINGDEEVISPTIQSLSCGYYAEKDTWYASNLNLGNSTNGLKVMDCIFSSLLSSGTHENFTFKRCFSNSNVTINQSLKSGMFENFGFVNLSFRDNPHKNLLFVNCSTQYTGLIEYNQDNARCTFINSCLFLGNNVKPIDSSFINCLIFGNSSESSSSSSYYENCWFVEGKWTGSAWNNEWLTENGYIGNDGTPIGYLGGQHPYDSSLSAGVPRVANSKVLLDTEKGTLDVEVEFEY